LRRSEMGVEGFDRRKLYERRVPMDPIPLRRKKGRKEKEVSFDV